MGIVGSQKARFAAIFLLPAIAAGVVPASVVAQAAPGADAPMQMRLAALPPSPGPDGPGEDALATRVVSDYVALTANASADDVEAGVVFAVSQSKLSSDAAIAGLSRAAPAQHRARRRLIELKYAAPGRRRERKKLRAGAGPGPVSPALHPVRAPG